MIIKELKNNRGYTLLFAVLVSSVVLSVGISILTISKKEFLLSSAVRESVSAFYAADSGLECAIKHDNDGDFVGPLTVAPSCMGGSVNIIPLASSGSGQTSITTFQVKMPGNTTTACAIVTVSRYLITVDLIPNVPVTSIESRGYNLGWDTTNSSNPRSQISSRRVERAIRYTY